nr:stage V sporulation protein AE [bacterium]
MMFLKAFFVGGAICALAQILLEKTKLTAPKILVLMVTLGAGLGILGIYPKLIEFAGAGASVPLLGFGASLAKGAQEAALEQGWLGVFLGGIKSTAGGITAAVVFGYLAAILFNPKTKP